MSREFVPVQPRVSDQLHPAIYVIIAGLMLLFVVSAFAAFADTGYADYLVAVVAVSFVIAMGLPYLLWRAWRSRIGGRQIVAETLRDWSAGECDMWQCRIRGRDAAIQALPPIAVVAVGLSAIGIVLLLVAHQMV